MNTTSPQVASCELRVASDDSRLVRAPRAPRYSLLAARRRPRRGISLLEVLIAMFVMLFGLMGVAAIMPVGNHYAARSDQYDRGAALANSAFAELKSRGMLQPGQWLHPNKTAVIFPSGPNVGNFTLGNDAGHAFVIDPVGSAQAIGDTAANLFPYGGWQATPNTWSLQLSNAYTPTNTWPVRRVSFADGVGNPIGSQVAAAIFRLRDDLTGELPTQGDHPGIQRWETADINPSNGNPNNTPDYPADDTLLARAYAGSYSWLATVLPVNADALLGLQPANPRHGSFLYEVSVAVFRKREDVPNQQSERVLQAELGPGGNLVVYGPSYADVDDASQDIRAGDWIALAGVHPTSGKFLLKWYRLLSYEDETDDEPLLSAPATRRPGRLAMVEGPEWPPNAPTSNPLYSTNLRAILLPNIIGVATQTLKLETN